VSAFLGLVQDAGLLEYSSAALGEYSYATCQACNLTLKLEMTDL